MKQIFSILIAFCLAACGSGADRFEPGKSLYKPRFAAGFEIFEAGRHSRAIRITDPWQGASGVENWVFIAQEGEEPPKNFSGAVIRGAARRIVCMSSSYVAFLAELGAADRVVGVSGLGFITDSLVRARARDVGYDTSLDYELVASMQPDLMLLYGIRDDGGVTAKLREMNIQHAFVGDYLEPSPLGRAEWMVAVGAMCGSYDGAVERFGQIVEAYDRIKAGIDRTRRKPKVMMNAPYKDVWYVPGDDNFMVQLVRDAGGEYVCAGTAGHDSRPLNIETAWTAMQRADYWIGTGHYATLAALKADNPRFADSPPVLSGRVFNNNARMTAEGGSDFWESGVVRPDRVLADLANILSGNSSKESLYYYTNLE